MRKLWLIWFALVVGISQAFAVDRQKDIDTLCYRLQTGYLSESVNLSDVRGFVSSMRDDGSWGDVDYKTVTFYFDADKHLKRLRGMALAYCKPGSELYHQQELKDKIVRGLDFFRRANPSSGNWWYNDIGAPTGYMVPLLLIKNHIGHEDRMRLSSYLVDKTDNAAHKGKNRTWVSAVLLHKGCIEDNYDLVWKGFSSIASTIRIEDKDDEGIKRDNSIHQHRPQLYSGGYGMSFMSDLAEYITLADHTSFMDLFTGEKMEIISDVMLKGTQLFGYRDSYDFGTIGRGISGPNSLHNMSMHTLDLMKKIDWKHAADYEAWQRHIRGEAFPAPGNKFFWKSNIMTHHGLRYYMSAKVISVRSNGTEMLNGQNLKGYYLPLGATNIMTTGQEYKDVFAVWDWTRVPGTTAVANQSTAELRWYLFGSNRFAGGVSNGRNGIIAYEHVYQGVQAQKAYFFLGDAMVCLGAGITAARTQEVRTSVNQCLADGDVTYGVMGRVDKLTDELSDTSIDWVYHNNVGYVFPEGGNITCRRTMQTGTWRDIAVTGSEEQISKDVFSVWLSHGTTPQNDTYCYIVMPDKPLSFFTTDGFDSQMKIVANTEKMQAVVNEDRGQYAVVFYEPGNIKFPDGLCLSADKKSLIYVEKKGTGYEFAVADPLYQEQSVRITINKTLAGECVDVQGENSILEVVFPVGDYVGSTVLKSVEEVL